MDLYPPVLDDNIPDRFQGEENSFETNVVHKLTLKLEDFPQVEEAATTSACTDHARYAEEGNSFLEFLKWFGFRNALSAFDRFANGNGDPLISSSESDLSNDIAATSTFKTWFRANVETAMSSKRNQLLRDGFQLGTPYSLSFAGKSVPENNLAFSAIWNPDLFLTIGGTQPSAPTVTGGPNDFGGRVQVIIESISPPVVGSFGLVKYRWLVTLEDRYNFDVEGDNADVWKSYLNIFARGQQICGEAQWFPHEMTIDSGSRNFVLKFDPTTDKPGKDALLGSDATEGQNGELILASSIVETNSQPVTYLA